MGSGAPLDRLARAVLLPGFVGTEDVPDWLPAAYGDGLAAVCLYGENVVDAEQLARLCAGLRTRCPDLLVAADEEGGDVTRVHYPGGSPEPGNAVLGRLDDVGATEAAARRIGAGLAGLGIGLDLAPVVDVNSADDNPVIGPRSFGADPDLVARHGAAYVRGLHAAGVAACAKHFPGHGDTTVDSHLDLPRVDAPAEVLRARELVPFAAAVAAGAECVMTSHVVVSAVDPTAPATFSPAVLGGLLRDRLGFGGVVVTDALDMAGASASTGVPGAAVRALVAGADLLCLGPGTTGRALEEVVAALVAAVADGSLPEPRLADAADRVRRLVSRRAVPRPAAEGLGWGEPLTGSRLSEAFALSAGVPGWLADPGPAVAVQVDTAANPAVGQVTWGPAAAGVPVVAETAGPPGAKVAVVGRAVSAGHPARAAVDRLRATGHPTLLVDCGWPRGPVDVATYGGSPAVAAALAGLLGLGAAGVTR